MIEFVLGLVFLSIVFVSGFIYGGNYAHKNGPKSSYDRVKEFHSVFGHPAPNGLHMADDDRSNLRIALIQEELDELKVAVAENDIVGIADALGDLDYVVNGAAVEYGIILPAITAEIHNSNMTKLGPDGKPIYREDGKILKGEGYRPPNLEPILNL